MRKEEEECWPSSAINDTYSMSARHRLAASHWQREVRRASQRGQ